MAAAADYSVGDYVKVKVTLGQQETPSEEKFVGAIITGKHEQGGYNCHIPGYNKTHNKHIYKVNEAAENVPAALMETAHIPQQLTVNSSGGQAGRINGAYNRVENHGDRPCWVKTCDDGVEVAIALAVFKGKNTWIITRKANLNQDGGYAICAWDMWLPTEVVPDNECWGIWVQSAGEWSQDQSLKITV